MISAWRLSTSNSILSTESCGTLNSTSGGLVLDEAELELDPLPPELLPAAVAIVVDDDELAFSPPDAVTETLLGSLGESVEVAESDVATVESGVVVAIVLPSVEVAV